MHLHTPQSAVLAAVIFNALIIIALVPLALRGVKYRPEGAAAMLRRNLLIYGIGGIIAPFPGIWLIDRLLGLLHSGVGPSGGASPQHVTEQPFGLTKEIPCVTRLVPLFASRCS